MIRRRKPSVITNCLANKFVGYGERIVEVADAVTGKGCLINVRRTPEGNLMIRLYRADPGVYVGVAQAGPFEVPQ